VARGSLSICCLAGLAALAQGACGPSVMNLSYERGTYARKVSPVRVGVYHLADERPGWPATAAMRMIGGSSRNNSFAQHTRGDKDVNLFITRSLRGELAATGMKVSTSPEFDRLDVYATADSARAVGVDRIVLGRINYFGFVGPVPGSAIRFSDFNLGGGLLGMVNAERRQHEEEGIIFDPDERAGRAYVDIDLWVVEPRGRAILWAGTARAKRYSNIVRGKVADRVEAFLGESLYFALRDTIGRADFLAAMGVAPAPPPVKAQVVRAPSREPVARALFDAGHFAAAALEFEKVYRATRDPAILYNLGLCYRQAGNAKLALARYEEYLRQVPGSPHRPAVEARIKELRQRLSTP